jgi:hypothetical protein
MMEAAAKVRGHAMPSFSHDEISFDEMSDLLAYIRAARLSGPPYRPLR